MTTLRLCDVILHKPSQLFQFFGRNNLSARCQLGSIGASAHVYVETVAMADRLSKNFGKLGLAGLGNRNGDDEEHEDESAQTEGEKSPEGKPDGGVPEPGAVATYNFMLDLSVPGHFPTQSAARRYLHNILCLG
jgi:hypothetical protein